MTLTNRGCASGPVVEDPGGARAAGQIAVPREQAAHASRLASGRPAARDRPCPGCSGAWRSRPCRRDVGDAAAHAGGEVAAGAAEDDHDAAGHVLAAVIAHALDHGHGAAVADGEALAGQAVDEHLAAGGAVEHDVADDDVFFGQEGGGLGRVGDDPPAGKALAQVIVGVAVELERDAGGRKAPKLWPAEPRKWKWIVSSGRPGGAVAAGDFAAEDRADGAVDVADGEADLRRASADSSAGLALAISA